MERAGVARKAFIGAVERLGNSARSGGSGGNFWAQRTERDQVWICHGIVPFDLSLTMGQIPPHLCHYQNADRDD